MDHFDFFQQELAFLRNSVSEFTQAYPEAATELKLSAGRSNDPHVEQLLQSFAFLTGKLRQDLELHKDQLANQMLYNLYPNLISSVPCMTVLQADVLPDGANFLNGSMLEKGSYLTASAKITNNPKRIDCQFQNCYDTPLWPLHINRVHVSPKNHYDLLDNRNDVQAVISVDVINDGEGLVKEYPMNSLRFYIANRPERSQIYQLLKDNLVGVAVKTQVNNQTVIKPLPNGKLRWLGFDQRENVLPDSPQTMPGYRLMQEYFAFSDKFYFFDVEGLELDHVDKQFELLFFLNEPGNAISINRKNLSLNCFPVINLFLKTFKPVPLDQTQHEYRLTGDENNYLYNEIHSISEMRAIGTGGVTRQVNHWLGQHSDVTSKMHYAAHLTPLLTSGEPGCDTMITLYEDNFDVTKPVDQTLSVNGWCNNRRLPEWLRAGDQFKDKFRPIGLAPMLTASIIEQPTRFKGAQIQGERLLKLLSQLRLNVMSLGNSDAQLSALKQLLYLYSDPKSSSHMRQLEGIREMGAESIVKRLGKDAWRGHCRGTRITITVDENYYTGANPLLFGEVLSHFMGLYTTVNHFVQLQLKSQQRGGVWKQWQPRIGEQILL